MSWVGSKGKEAYDNSEFIKDTVATADELSKLYGTGALSYLFDSPYSSTKAQVDDPGVTYEGEATYVTGMSWLGNAVTGFAVARLAATTINIYMQPGKGAFRDVIPDHIKVSRTELRDFIKENNIPLKDGWDADKLYDKVLSVEKPNRMKPEDYLPPEYIAAKLAEFDSGVVRITGRAGFNEFGTLFKGDEGFCLPRAEFERIRRETGGDLKAMGERLNLGRDLDPNKDMIAFIERKDVPTLKAPSGNEVPLDLDSGANREWTPGLKTKNGVTEAVMSFPPGTDLKKIVTELKL